MATDPKQITIHLEPTSRHSWIEIDGERQDGVRSVVVRADADALATVTVEYVNVRVDIDGDAEVVRDVTELGDDFRRYRAS